MIRCCLLALCVAPLFGADLAVGAACARRDAEADLAALRSRILDERTELAHSLAIAEGASHQARRQLAVILAQQARAETARDERQRAVTLATHEAAGLLDRLVQATGASSSTMPAVHTAVAQRLEQLRLDLQVQRSEQSVIARDGRITTVPVLRLGAARAVACGSDSTTQGLLTRTADGHWRVGGPVVSADATTVPLDLAGTLGDAPERHFSLIGWLRAGRFFIWPILILAAVGLVFSLQRAWVLWGSARSRRSLLPQVLAEASAGRIAAAQTLVASGRDPLARVLAGGLATLGRERPAREAALEQALLGEEQRLTRGLAAILVIAGVCPLLGLLGTVTGMIDLFGVIAQHGSGSARGLTGGISEALVVTQAGMLAAVPLLLLHAMLTRTAERRLLLLDEAAVALLSLDRQP